MIEQHELGKLPEHDAIREGDELCCHICGKRWAHDDPAPKCISQAEAKRRRGLENIAKIRRTVLKR